MENPLIREAALPLSQQIIFYSKMSFASPQSESDASFPPSPCKGRTCVLIWNLRGNPQGRYSEIKNVDPN